MKWGQRIVVGLVGLCLTFLASTVWLYLESNEQQQKIYMSSRSSAWINYQAQIEYLQSLSALQHCASGGKCNVDSILSQLKFLVVRLNSLVELERSAHSPNPNNYDRRLQSFYQLLLARSQVIGAKGMDASMAAAAEEELLPLGTLLQTVLGATVLRPTNGKNSEDLLRLTDASVPFILLIASGVGLMAVLARELRLRGALLREIGALRNSERDLQAGMTELLEALPVPVLVTAADGHVTYANCAAKNLASSANGEADVDALAATIRLNFGPLEGSENSSRDFPAVSGDGSVRHLSVRARDIRLLGRAARVCVISDNTLLRDAELRAMTAGKLAILGELSSAIAHELNQPLAVIKAAAANGKIHAMSGDNAGRLVDKLVRIDEQVERARRIMDNVRKLGRPAQPHWTPFPVSRSLGSALGLVSQQYRLAGVALEIDVDIADSVTVFGDPTLFEIAVLNVLLNARDAFARTDRAEKMPSVKVSARGETGTVRVVIADNAGGIPQYIMPQIFNSFVSSKPPEIGTGLGLSIARRAVEGMRGSIQAENSTEGAVFTIHLPVLVQEAAA